MVDQRSSLEDLKSKLSIQEIKTRRKIKSLFIKRVQEWKQEKSARIIDQVVSTINPVSPTEDQEKQEPAKEDYRKDVLEQYQRKQGVFKKILLDQLGAIIGNLPNQEKTEEKRPLKNDRKGLQVKTSRSSKNIQSESLKANNSVGDGENVVAKKSTLQSLSVELIKDWEDSLRYFVSQLAYQKKKAGS